MLIDRGQPPSGSQSKQQLCLKRCRGGGGGSVLPPALPSDLATHERRTRCFSTPHTATQARCMARCRSTVKWATFSYGCGGPPVGGLSLHYPQHRFVVWGFMFDVCALGAHLFLFLFEITFTFTASVTIIYLSCVSASLRRVGWKHVAASRAGVAAAP